MKSIKIQTRKFNIFLLLVVSLSLCCVSQISSDQEQIEISDINDGEYYRENNQNYDEQQMRGGSGSQQQITKQMQYASQLRTACLVLSRYYLNQFSEQINGIVKDLISQDQSKFINKLYITAVEKCEPLMTQMEVMQFFTSNQNFDPSSMFYIFDGFNFYELNLSLDDQLTPRQKGIIKFIKNFDAQMQVRKQQQQAQKMAQQKDQGLQVFFISLKNLSSKAKYIYIIAVLLISAAILWYGFSQIGQKPQKKDKKKKKSQ